MIRGQKFICPLYFVPKKGVFRLPFMTRLLMYSWVEPGPNAFSDSRRHSNKVYSARKHRLAPHLELVAHILVRTVGPRSIPVDCENMFLVTPPYTQDSNMPRIKKDVFYN